MWNPLLAPGGLCRHFLSSQPDLAAPGTWVHPSPPQTLGGRRMAQVCHFLICCPFPCLDCDLLIFVCFEQSDNLVLFPHPTQSHIRVALEVCYLDSLSICPTLSVAVLHVILFKNKVEKVTTKYMTAWQKQQLLPIRQNRIYSPGYVYIGMDVTEQEREERGLT